MKNEREIIIAELLTHGVTNNPRGGSLHKMDYQSLVRLLAIRRVMAE